METFFFDGGFEIFFSLIFFIAVGMIIFSFVLGIREWNKNNHSPRLTVDATIATKRNNVSYHHHNSSDGVMHTTHSTTYYVTFEVESGDRMEFIVNGSEYGMLVEGDHGRLTFQGTRYIGFERI